MSDDKSSLCWVGHIVPPPHQIVSRDGYEVTSFRIETDGDGNQILVPHKHYNAAKLVVNYAKHRKEYHLNEGILNHPQHLICYLEEMKKMPQEMERVVVFPNKIERTHKNSLIITIIVQKSELYKSFEGDNLVLKFPGEY